MKEIGDILRRKREEQDLSLADVQRRTRIHTKWLQALEAGDETAFPAEVYLKGFLRSYADALGLDGVKMLEQWQERREAIAPAGDEDDGEEGEERQGRDPGQRPVTSWARPQTKGLADLFAKPGRSRRRVPIMLVIALMVIAGIWWLWQEGADRTSAGPGNDVIVTDPAGEPGDQKPDEDNAAPNAPVAGAEEPTPVVVEQLEGDSDDEIIFVVHGAGTVVVEATANPGMRCWVNVTSDGEQVFSGNVVAGDARRWTADVEMVARAGNPPALALTINGTEIERFDTTTVLNIRVQANP